MTIEVDRVEIYYSDGTSVQITRFELERIEKLMEAIDLLERAKTTYSHLKEVFEKPGGKK